VLANVLLGINQGLCWSTTVIMKIDLVGPQQRGLAMGLNEFSGYVAVSLSALATGYIASTYALRPQPFYLGIAFALLGLFLSVFFVQETHGHARAEAKAKDQILGIGDQILDIRDSISNPQYLTPNTQYPISNTQYPISNTQYPISSTRPSFAQVMLITSWKDRALFAVSQAGMINNLNDGMVWGLLPIFLAGAGLSVERIGIVAAVYPGVWGMSQLVTGALSDRLGRKWMIAAGLWVQAAGIGMVIAVHDFALWVTAAAVMGLGTALVYPTLLAAVSDVAHPEWRASAVGVYRLWRDGGYAVGALLSGVLADALGMGWAIGAIGGLTAISGFIVAVVMYETLATRRMPVVSVPAPD